MTKKQKRSHVFDNHLREDEYIIWQGNVVSGSNYLHPIRYLSHLKWFVDGIFFILKKITFPALVIFSVFFIGSIMWMSRFWKNQIISFYCIPFTLILILNLSKYSQVKKEDQRGDVAKPLEMKDKSMMNFFEISNPWEKNQYAITNQRVLLYKNGSFRETSLILMQDAVKKKPKNGTVDINLYDQRSPTGQLPAPIATLNNLSEADAESAYDLLVKARDLSFEERIEDMGLD